MRKIGPFSKQSLAANSGKSIQFCGNSSQLIGSIARDSLFAINKIDIEHVGGTLALSENNGQSGPSVAISKHKFGNISCLGTTATKRVGDFVSRLSVKISSRLEY